MPDKSPPIRLSVTTGNHGQLDTFAYIFQSSINGGCVSSITLQYNFMLEITMIMIPLEIWVELDMLRPRFIHNLESRGRVNRCTAPILSLLDLKPTL